LSQRVPRDRVECLYGRGHRPFPIRFVILNGPGLHMFRSTLQNRECTHIFHAVTTSITVLLALMIHFVLGDVCRSDLIPCKAQALFTKVVEKTKCRSEKVALMLANIIWLF